MTYIILNGEKTSSNSRCISPYDRGFTLGHGIFETIMIKDGTTPLLSYHWDRITKSLEVLGIKIPFDFLDLARMIDSLITDNKLSGSRGGIRLTITDGVSARGLLSDGTQSPTFILTTFNVPDPVDTPMNATIVETRRNENSLSSKIKSISYLDNILAQKEALSKGFDLAILLNSKSNVAEGAISNIFAIKRNKIYTPLICDGALPGVVRHVLLNVLEHSQYSIHEKTITVNELYDADEVFITNALLGVKKIARIDEIKYMKGDITSEIQKQFIKQFSY